MLSERISAYIWKTLKFLHLNYYLGECYGELNGTDPLRHEAISAPTGLSAIYLPRSPEARTLPFYFPFLLYNGTNSSYVRVIMGENVEMIIMCL